ncbi:NAD(P)/FAD-dependent oxidoreductase [Nordella sp. HKS 07]|uniref:NAD(P)/FAD-dependent oxidoreductase n=1 Tax=Nordella sp. HKS 07 TaxID=2712222 RepID=UPI0013E19C7A|nr:NAD(P)/FAD-dependent oxidoreductase [Nordella sp. HKS 07]QIG47820.1 NAD(P)/FAD-dependent oxidoreductase [Nordella sp. HKS 07]
MESSTGIERADVVVIGAGIIGLAVARALALAGRDVLVLETRNAIGTETSSRNSEVVHAGIYYPQGSLKARLCVLGRQLLYQYCDERRIAHRRLGKLIVAARADEVAALRALQDFARRNGVDDLVWLDRQELQAREPALSGEAALFSPSTGIVDIHELMLSYRGDLENHGGVVAFSSEVLSAQATNQGFRLAVDSGGPFELLCRSLVNCAGLGAQKVAQRIDGLPEASIPKLRLAKGNYFRLAQKAPFRHLIYPMPTQGGLGVHLTLDLGGQARFGPDVEWVDSIDYKVSDARRAEFEASIRQYWPSLPADAIFPDYCGIRPKLHGPGEPAADFVIQGEAVHGVPGLINLYGIESPGLTSSLAIAEHVAQTIAGRTSFQETLSLTHAEARKAAS